MGNPDATTGGLEQEVLARFQGHVAKTIDSYCRHKGYNLADAGRTLDIPRRTLANYQKKVNIPLWGSYFGLMIQVDEGEKPSKERVQKIVGNLREFFKQSIQTHCRMHGISLKDFCKSIGFHESSGYIWTSEESSGHLPKAKDFFKVMANIYVGEKAADAIMYPLENWQKLEAGQYDHLLKGLVVAEAAGEGYEIPEGGAEQDLATILNKSHEFILDSPQGNAFLMRAALFRIGEIIAYFRERGEKEREILRRICRVDKFAIRDITVEARQIVREEKDYQGYLAMNKGLSPDDTGGGE